MNRSSLGNALCLGAMALTASVSFSQAATILTFESTDKNRNLDSSYGSFATESQSRQGNGIPGYTVNGYGTPNIAVLFAPFGTTGASGSFNNVWQVWHETGKPWAGGVGQVENANSSVTFTPNVSTAAVKLESFLFIGDTNNDAYDYLVRVIDLSNNDAVLFSQDYQWTVSAADRGPAIALDIEGTAGHSLKLELTRRSGPQGNIAIDNLQFSQVNHSIPEPVTVTLAGGALLFGIVRRKR